MNEKQSSDKPNYELFRTGLSSYWPENFLSLEKNSFADFKEITYLGLMPEKFQIKKPLIAITNTHFDRKLQLLWMEKNYPLSLIIHANSGYDLFTEPFLDFFKMTPLLLGPELRMHAVAEYYIHCFLHAAGTLPFKKSWDMDRQYPRKLLKNMSILLIGYGHVGKILEKILIAFHCKVQIFDPHQFPKNSAQHILDLPIEEMDGIFCCCDLNKSSKSLIDKKVLQRCKNNIIIINAARGEICQEIELYQFAKKNVASQIFLDVFEKEPMDFQDWNQLPNVHLSSHVAGNHENLILESLEWQKNVVKNFLELTPVEFLKNYQQINLQDPNFPRIK